MVNKSGVYQKIISVICIASFVINSILITFADDQKNNAGKLDTVKVDDTGKSYLVGFKDSVNINNFIDKEKLNTKVSKKFKYLKSVVLKLNSSEVQKLINSDEVRYVEIDSTVKIASIGPVQKEHKAVKFMEEDVETVPWGVNSIGAHMTLADNHEGNNINIAILDTGCVEHPDLKIRGGMSFVPGNVSYYDDNGHGTHVAGTVAAINNKLGVIGIAPEATLYVVKVLDKNGSGTYSQIIEGIEWAIYNKIDVINMSFGGTEDSQALHDSVKEAARSGVLIVAAAGNYGAGLETETYPARYPEVISVGAIDQTMKITSYSSTGSEIDLVAPGSEILSTTSDYSYGVMSGTSMAAPHVAGAAAVLWSMNRKWSSDQIKHKLYQTATPLGESSVYGNGLVNVAKAVGLSDMPIITPVPQLTPHPDPTDKPSIPRQSFDIIKIDIQFAEYKNKLRDLYEMANKNGQKILAKSILEKLNGMIVAENKLRIIPEGLRKSTNEKYVNADTLEYINSYYTLKADDFMTLGYDYQKAINEFVKAISTTVTNSVYSSVYEQPKNIQIQNIRIATLNTNTVTSSVYSSVYKLPLDIDLAVGDYMVFEFTPLSTSTYNIFTGPYGRTGSVNDTYLELYTDSSLANRIVYDDDSAADLFSNISATLIKGTTYYLKLRPTNSSIALHTRLTVTKEAPIEVVNLNIPIDTQIFRGEYKIYSFTPSVEGIYKFYTRPYGDKGTSSDTYIELYNDKNMTNMVAYDDDSAGNGNSSIKLNLNGGTTYYLKMEGYDNDSVSASLMGTAEITNYDIIPLGTVVNINNVTEKWYRLDIPVSSGYKIETGLFGSTAYDTHLTLYDSLVNPIEYDDDDGINRFSLIKRDLSIGTYYIKVRNYYSGSLFSCNIKVDRITGSYGIKITAPPAESPIICRQGKDVFFELYVINEQNINNRRFVITYDSNVLDVLDLSTFTQQVDLSVSSIPGTDITITKFTQGSIEFTVNKSIPLGQGWSGIINGIKFKAKISGQTAISSNVVQ